MTLIHRFIDYIRSVRRYSQRTAEIYESVLNDFCRDRVVDKMAPDSELIEVLTLQHLRSYEVNLLDDRSLSPKTVNLHLSVLSRFCNYLIKLSLIDSNPVSLISRPKVQKRLPEFYRTEALCDYFTSLHLLFIKQYALTLLKT